MEVDRFFQMRQIFHDTGSAQSAVP